MRGSIRESGKGSWRIEISNGWGPSEKDSTKSKRKRVYRTVRGTKAEAMRELTRLLRELDTGVEIDPERMTVAEYFQRWLDHSRTRVRPRTWARYESLIRVHVLPRIGSEHLSKIRPTHVQAVLDDMTGKGQSARSVVQCHRVIGAALRQAQRWQLIAINPAQAVQAPRPERPDLAIPTTTDLATLMTAARGSVHETAIVTSVGTGLRRGELLALKWRDLDLDTARIHVVATLQRHPKVGGGFELKLFEPKTQRARREVALPPFVVDTLRRQKASQAQRRLLLGAAWVDKGFVFDAGDGQPVDPDRLSAAFRRIAKAAGLPTTRLHDVRHGYATALLTEGVHPKIASEALGHSSVAFTLDTYSHVVQGLQDKAADAIQNALGGVATANLGE